ncbi:MAG: hypothetical protein IJ600_04375 [Lachnospiraceae bacterium]|nr:hypothetical protein [Lachnospiraceae bacterium]
MQEPLTQFWEKEQEANLVRKQSLDQLDYIRIPEEFYSVSYDAQEDKDAAEALQILNSLRDEKIVNLTGISNTDLKLSFGPANLPELSRFDQNYTLLARALQSLAEYHARKEQTDEAQHILEFALDTGTDISSSYRLLADLYIKNGCPEKINEMLPKAAALKSAMSAAIIRSLEEKKASV